MSQRLPADARRHEQEAIPTILDPLLFRAIVKLCKESLLYSGNQRGMRDQIVALIGALRLDAEAKFGHDTPDIRELVSLLRRTDPQRDQYAIQDRPPPELDPIEELQRQRHLKPEAFAAALFVRKIWQGWGRFLTVAARNYEKQSAGARAKALDPFNVMGQTLYDKWHLIYSPWYDAAKQKEVLRRDGRMITRAKVVLQIVLTPVFPGKLDRCEGLPRGTSLMVLKDELTGLAGRQDAWRKTHGSEDDSIGPESR